MLCLSVPLRLCQVWSEVRIQTKEGLIHSPEKPQLQFLNAHLPFTDCKPLHEQSSFTMNILTAFCDSVQQRKEKVDRVNYPLTLNQPTKEIPQG